MTPPVRRALGVWAAAALSVPAVDAIADPEPPVAPAPQAAREPAVPSPAAPPVPARTECAVEFPHPLVVEVLYAVPVGPAGDANKDGVRDAAGDEFIELVNPHDKPIQLLGYTLADSAKGEKTRVRFTFPACELAPGALVVVFNGHGATWTGPVGDAKSAPAGGNDRFAGALVFTMRIASPKAALGNQGDEVGLTAPNGKPVQRLRWGTAAEGAKPDPAVPLEETLPLANRCSVQRAGTRPGDPWLPHTEAADGPFSPGTYKPSQATPQH